ncbi:hypothetical protein IFR05_003749 [Cadophora sp. M221]|nr:hypothetical protein IFR05_003749 [Cadophora sp. M221]
MGEVGSPSTTLTLKLCFKLQGHRVTTEQWKLADSEVQPVECEIGFFRHIQDIFHEHEEDFSKQTTRPPQRTPKALSGLIFTVTDCPDAKDMFALIDEHGRTQIPLQDLSNIAYVVGDGNESPEVIKLLHKHKPTLTDLRGLLTMVMNMSGGRRVTTPQVQIERELPPRSLKRPLEQKSEGYSPEKRRGLHRRCPPYEQSRQYPRHTTYLASIQHWFTLSHLPSMTS